MRLLRFVTPNTSFFTYQVLYLCRSFPTIFFQLKNFPPYKISSKQRIHKTSNLHSNRVVIKPKRLKDLSPNRGTDVDDWENSRDAHEASGPVRHSTGNKNWRSKSRHYRSAAVETPSHTVGVNEEIREKQLKRLERDRETRGGGVYAESIAGAVSLWNPLKRFSSHLCLSFIFTQSPPPLDEIPGCTSAQFTRNLGEQI